MPHSSFTTSNHVHSTVSRHSEPSRTSLIPYNPHIQYVPGAPNRNLQSLRPTGVHLCPYGANNSQTRALFPTHTPDNVNTYTPTLKCMIGSNLLANSSTNTSTIATFFCLPPAEQCQRMARLTRLPSNRNDDK